VERFVEQLSKSRKHYNEKDWLRFVRKRDIQSLDDTSLLIFTEFSATMDLRATETDCCSFDSHAVLDIYVVLHSPKRRFDRQEGRVFIYQTCS
jgi:hypothetical protein